MATPEEIKKLQEEARLKLQQSGQVSNTSAVRSFAAAAGQGLTFGFSDEIAAGISSLGSLFKDETFQESFDRTLAEKRRELEEYNKANPKTALVGEIIGSVAPAVASLLLTPFTGGTSSAGVAATATRILNNPLLAGKISQPGLGLVAKSLEASKIGALQGAVAGAGYAEGSAGEKIFGGGLGGVAGGLVGGALPSAITGISKTPQILTKPFKKSQLQKFNKDEIKSIKIIGNKFAEDKISLESVIQQIDENVEANKLIGLAPIEILADYGGDAVNRKLRGIKTRVPGMNIDQQLIERTSGTVEQKAKAIKDLKQPTIQSTRILKQLQDSVKKTIKTPKISLDSGIDDLEKTIQSYLSPLYESAFLKNQRVSNLNLYKNLNRPVLKDGYEEARNVYKIKLDAEGRQPFEIPSLEKLYIKENGQIVGVNKELPLEFLDLVKKSVDQQTYAKLADRVIDREVARNRKKIGNDFRNILKDSVIGSEYKDALSMAADRFALQDAFEKGVLFKKPSTSSSAFNKEFSKLNTDIERDAFKIGVFQEIYNEINKVGDNLDLVKKIFNSPDLRQKLTIMFGDDLQAREQFIKRLVREANIAKNTATVIGGSNTAEKVLDAQDALQNLSDLVVAGTAPTSSAGIRAEANLARKVYDNVTNPTEKRARGVGKILLEQNPQRQQEILDLILQLQKQEKSTGILLDQAIIRPTTRFGVQQLPQAFADN
jgi:hypothetical protein